MSSLEVAMLMGRQFEEADRYVDYANLDSRYDFLLSSTFRHSSDHKLTHFARCLRGCRRGSYMEQERGDEAGVFWLLEGHPDWRQVRSALAEAAVPLVIRGDPFVCTLSPCSSKICQSTGVRMRSRYHSVFLVITRYRRNLPHFCIKCNVMEMQKLVHTATSARRLAIAVASGTLSGWACELPRLGRTSRYFPSQLSLQATLAKSCLLGCSVHTPTPSQCSSAAFQRSQNLQTQAHHLLKHSTPTPQALQAHAQHQHPLLRRPLHQHRTPNHRRQRLTQHFLLSLRAAQNSRSGEVRSRQQIKIPARL